VHCFETLPQNVHCQADRARERISRRELRQTDRLADEATADARDIAVAGRLRPRSNVAGDRHLSGVCRSRVFLSVSLSQFSSRNRASDVDLAVNCSLGASRKRALACLVNDTIRADSGVT